MNNLISSNFQDLIEINESLRRYSKILRLHFYVRCIYSQAKNLQRPDTSNKTDTHRPYMKLKLKNLRFQTEENITLQEET